MWCLDMTSHEEGEAPQEVIDIDSVSAQVNRAYVGSKLRWSAPGLDIPYRYTNTALFGNMMSVWALI